MHALAPLFDTKAGVAWKIFAGITEIPHPSGHEERLREWLRGLAQEQNWDTAIDAAGNLLVRVPGRGNLAQDPPLILQGHLDMVCEKNQDTVYDFLHDPLPVEIAGHWVQAVGTTLGADNGVAPALAMAVAIDETLPHRRPLELLFTVDEETGLNGALGLDASHIRGRQLINLDGNDDGTFVIGCAGGIDFTMEFPLQPATSGVKGLKFQLTGLRGGHSGTDIHEPRSNALRVCARILAGLKQKVPGIELRSFQGGNKKNAIPREASFIVTGATSEELASTAFAIADEIRENEPGVCFEICETVCPQTVLDWKVVSFINSIPNGVIAMEPDFPEQIRISSSLGVAELTADGLIFKALCRAAARDDRLRQSEAVKKLTLEYAGSFSMSGDYPGWRPQPDSALLRQAMAVYEKLYDRKPKVECIHAGLEAGIIGEKIGSTELIALGPDMEGYHAPGERLNIASFERVYLYLQEIISAPVHRRSY